MLPKITAKTGQTLVSTAAVAQIERIMPLGPWEAESPTTPANVHHVVFQLAQNLNVHSAI